MYGSGIKISGAGLGVAYTGGSLAMTGTDGLPLTIGLGLSLLLGGAAILLVLGYRRRGLRQ